MFILPLDSPSAALENSGGKGLNLARLARAGFNVPGGILVTTDAYRDFVSANHLEAWIEQRLTGLDGNDPQALETASNAIRSRFAAGEIPSALVQAVSEAYQEIGAPAVAVRSSATAEDLPDLSFAGQQDTYLNIIGQEAVLKAVVECWSSLWTARAIGYRMRNHIPHRGAALAVVVQALVNSEVSGVLFTANPLTGLLSETVIDATFGLGEALVSGQVEPDHYVVDALTREVRTRTLGGKQVATRISPAGGVETRAEDAADHPTLSDDQILQLAALGQQVQAQYGTPQDIEWAFAGGNLYLLQSRPITSLFPVPWVSYDPLEVWFSFGAIQGVVGPMTPLGCSGIRGIVAGAGAIFGITLDPETVDVFSEAGGRIWVKISDYLRSPLGSRTFKALLGFVEPSVGQILEQLAGDPHLGVGKGKLRPSTLGRLAGFTFRILSQMPGNMHNPEKARVRFDGHINDYLAAAKIPPGADRFERLANVEDFISTRVASVFSFLLPKFVPTFGPSMGALNLLNKLAGDDRALVLEITRGLPGNVTTEMDLALWAVAQAIRQDPAVVEVFTASTAETLADAWLQGTLPPAAQSAVTGFLTRYGMRGVGEIDLGQPRWREAPAPVMHILQSYLEIDPQFAPDILFQRGSQAAEAAIEKLASQVRGQHGGRIKEKLVRAAARRVRVLMGVRESPKFFAIRVMGIVRQALLEVGQEFIDSGDLDRPDDLVFLRLPELHALARRQAPPPPAPSWRTFVAEQRAAYEREMRRKQVPRVLVSDGRAFYEGLGAQSDSAAALSGSPVSPGVAEGLVRVVHDPRTTRLLPGEIMVCPGTDPAWTPLFLSAAGLVTEVGGIMTHGSVVAREYGIPAVVGVHQATQRLQTGQRIRIDGSAGTITILEP